MLLGAALLLIAPAIQFGASAAGAEQKMEVDVAAGSGKLYQLYMIRRVACKAIGVMAEVRLNL